LPRFRDAIATLSAKHPGLAIVLPTVRGVASLVREMTGNWPTRPLILEASDDKRAAFAAATLALAASGTVSLELAANRVPMVIAHDFNRLTWWLMKRAALIDTVTLVNIVSETRAVPEFLGPACQPAPIAAALDRLLTDPAARAAQEAAADLTMSRLGAKVASLPASAPPARLWPTSPRQPDAPLVTPAKAGPHAAHASLSPPAKAGATPALIFCSQISPPEASAAHLPRPAKAVKIRLTDSHNHLT
jgi:hypothetical protein